MNKNLFESLHKQYYTMVNQMCLGFVKGDYDVASDLSQEVFIIIWKKLDTFKETSTHKTWIYRITVNKCLEFIRKEKNKKTVPISTFAHELKEAHAEKKTDEHNELYTAIGQLKELDRLIIMMVLNGQEYEDISEVIGINPINTRVKIHRIKKRLKKILSNG
ncbi:RNA polymerase sigma factor [uncultured Tenacibaculum sp.]|uniref:RNA polymerase sigma factor n=1 Tax=uncultured Tenacibaculum sp. TaxID=174713 RepID=UPI00260D62F3|nr:RNA polymerase sigma factor [uncultured Tenacibaculum sp.]